MRSEAATAALNLQEVVILAHREDSYRRTDITANTAMGTWWNRLNRQVVRTVSGVYSIQSDGAHQRAVGLRCDNRRYGGGYGRGPRNPGWN